MKRIILKFLKITAPVFILYIIGAVILTFAAPNNYILDFEPIAFSIPLPMKFEGPLKRNNHLNDAQKLFVNSLMGPESIAIASNGQIFTGVENGHIYSVDIEKQKIKDFATIKGRPLGMRFDSKGNLYVAEAFNGLFRINSNGKVKRLSLGSSQTANKYTFKFLDDLVIDEGSGKDGGDVIYFSDVSSKYTINNMMQMLLEPDTTGRIVKYDINEDKVTVLLTDLWFPNGVELTDDKTALIFCETLKNRVMKYYIRGPRKGKTEIFIDRLQAIPDNIRRSLRKEETYWIGMALVFESPSLFDKISEYPLFRKFIMRSFHLFGMVFKDIGNLFGFEPLIEFGENFKSGKHITKSLLESGVGMAIEIDSKGKILMSLQTNDSSVLSLSEVREISNTPEGRVLLLGSYINNYIGKLTIK